MTVLESISEDASRQPAGVGTGGSRPVTRGTVVN